MDGGLAMDIELVAHEVVDSAMKVHSILGPGLLESAYKACLTYELQKRGLRVRTEVELPVIYDGVKVGVGYRVDQVVEECVITELKAVARLPDVHDAQLLSHLKLSQLKLGFRINFHVVHLKDGIRRMVNGL
jgi:GxxExxY protein